MSTSISGSVADTCRGGIDMFSFPDCRHSLGGAASTRLISPAASVYAVSRDVEVIVVRVGLIVAPGSQATSFAPLSVFETANFTLGERRYEVRVISETGGARLTRLERKLRQNRLAVRNSIR